ncbi:hypothetical protein MKJ23_003705 [Escherichia coli]|nr:hypothetical protein [Escherichia coli]
MVQLVDLARHVSF